MSDWYVYTCGHKGLAGLSGHREIPCEALCAACRDARIGEVIAFARHGNPPGSGTSRNHREQTGEVGVSVYEVKGGEIQYCGWYFEIAARPLFLGTGRIVGWGSDGEPLVKILRITKAKTT